MRIIDVHDGQLSLTNLAVLIVLIKLIAAPAVSLIDIGALLISLVNYTGKKLINKVPPEPEDTITPKVNELKESFEKMSSQVSALALNNSLTKLK